MRCNLRTATIRSLQVIQTTVQILRVRHFLPEVSRQMQLGNRVALRGFVLTPFIRI
jgi:hypothetical protein